MESSIGRTVTASEVERAASDPSEQGWEVPAFDAGEKVNDEGDLDELKFD